MMYRKMAIVGEVGSGKTELVNTLSEISPFSTEVESTVDIGKKFTTVGIDYGRLNLANDIVVGLYGLPGQHRYEFLWRMVCESLWGTVILVKYSDTLECEHIQRILRFFNKHSRNTPFLLGVTHCENESKESIGSLVDVLTAVLDDQSLQAPVIPFDPRDIKSSLLPLTVFNSLMQTSGIRNMKAV